MTYWRAGDQKRGQQTQEAALKLDPNRPEAKLAQDLLREAR